MNNKAVLVVGAILIAVGIFKPDLSNLIPKRVDDVVDVVVEIAEPTDADLKEAALKIVDIIKSGDNDRKKDGKTLAGLYIDLSRLISLDSENQVIKTTSEIREVNSVAGSLMNLQMQGKYPGLSTAAKELVVGAIGDDVSVLNEEQRGKAVAAFEALAWACFEGAK